MSKCGYNIYEYSRPSEFDGHIMSLYKNKPSPDKLYNAKNMNEMKIYLNLIGLDWNDFVYSKVISKFLTIHSTCSKDELFYA